MAAKKKDATESEPVASGTGTDDTLEAQVFETPGEGEATGETPPKVPDPDAPETAKPVEEDRITTWGAEDPEASAARPDSEPAEPPLADESVADRVVTGRDSLASGGPGPWGAPERRAAEEVAEPAAGLREPEPDASPEPPLSAAPSRREETVETDDEHHEEVEGSSFAARALVFLIALIIGAGLGIWGAPKLAPMLPSGMAPVAEWLTPGASEAEAAAEARIADLSARVDALSDQVEANASNAVTGDALDAVTSEIDAVRNSVEELGGSNTAQQIATLQSALQGQSSELASLKKQIEAAGASAAAGTGEGAGIDVYQAELEGLRGEVRTLTDRVAGLAHRIDEVAATADRSIDAAEAKVAEIQEEANTAMDRAAVDADVAIIRAALASGQPFQEPADRLASAENVTLPEGLVAAASTGVPTVQALRDDFPDEAHAAIRASVKAEAGEGIVDRSRAFLAAQLATRSLTPQEGNGTDAVLSRMEDRLRQGDLAAALAESAQLPDEAAAAMSGWLDAARMREAADAGLAELQASLPAIN